MDNFIDGQFEEHLRFFEKTLKAKSNLNTGHEDGQTRVQVVLAREQSQK